MRKLLNYLMLYVSLLTLTHSLGWATNPMLTNGTILVGNGDNPMACPNATSCTANAGAELTYESPTSVGGCHQMWSMNLNGGNKTNMSAVLIANGGFMVGGVQQITTALNQGSPMYSPDGNWVMFSYQVAGSGACIHNRTSGTGVANGVGICNVALTNCAGVLSCPVGCLHPTWTADGTKIVYGLLYPVSGAPSPWGYNTSLQWATFTAGTPPTVSAFTDVDPQGTGSKGTTNFYEPWDTDGWLGGTTCWVYYEAASLPSAPSLGYFAIYGYNICNATTTEISTPFSNRSATVTTSATQTTVGSSSITVASAKGILAGQVIAASGLATGTLVGPTYVTGSTTVPVTPVTTGSMTAAAATFSSPCFSEFWAINHATQDSAISTSSCPYWNSGQPYPGYNVLDIVMASRHSGQGMIQLTGFNLPGQPEYAYPVETSSPRWGSDGSFILVNVCGNCTLQDQQAGFPEPGVTSTIWKFTVALVPTQIQ